MTRPTRPCAVTTGASFSTPSHEPAETTTDCAKALDGRTMHARRQRVVVVRERRPFREREQLLELRELVRRRSRSGSPAAAAARSPCAASSRPSARGRGCRTSRTRRGTDARPGSPATSNGLQDGRARALDRSRRPAARLAERDRHEHEREDDEDADDGTAPERGAAASRELTCGGTPDAYAQHRRARGAVTGHGAAVYRRLPSRRFPQDGDAIHRPAPSCSWAARWPTRRHHRRIHLRAIGLAAARTSTGVHGEVAARSPGTVALAEQVAESAMPSVEPARDRLLQLVQLRQHRGECASITRWKCDVAKGPVDAGSTRLRGEATGPTSAGRNPSRPRARGARHGGTGRRCARSARRWPCLRLASRPKPCSCQCRS